MTDKSIFRLVHAEARRRAVECISRAPDGYITTVQEPNRNLNQNAAQWPVLAAFAAQLQWPVNGQMVSMADEDWKNVLTAAFRKETVRVAMGLDGGMVMLGLRTSEFGKKEFGEWLEFLHATAALRGVDLSYRVTDHDRLL